MRRRVYAITSAVKACPPVRGLHGERLTLVKAGRLAAVVGSARPMPPPGAATLASYHAVVQELARALPALLPCRYGCMEEPRTLDRLLRSSRRAWSGALRHVRGRVQMTIRHVGEPRASVPVPRRPAFRSGRAFLRARATEARRAPALDAVRPSIARWVRAERCETRGRVVTIYHLVPRHSADRYRQALVEAAHQAHVRLQVTGPFAPHAFADVSGLLLPP